MTFREFIEKMKKSSWKQTKSPGVRDMKNDLSKDFKGHMEKMGAVEPFKLKETTEYAFHPGDRVRLVQNFNRTGEVVGCVPGNGTLPWYFVKFNDGTEDRFTADELELS